MGYGRSTGRFDPPTCRPWKRSWPADIEILKHKLTLFIPENTLALPSKLKLRKETPINQHILPFCTPNMAEEALSISHYCINALNLAN